MELKHFKNKTGDSYELLLFGDIGYEISGTQIANELKWLNENGAKEILIRINSGGGSILDGFSIVSAIMNSTAIITTSNEGIAASMAGIIFVTGNIRKCKDFSKLMVHDPSFGGRSMEDEQDEKRKTALVAMKDMLTTVLVNNSKLTKTQISKLMTEETWFSAQEAKDLGLVDDIEKTKLRVQSGISLMEYMNIASNYFNNLNDIIMFKNLTAHLGLVEDASEEVILNGVKSLEAKNELLKLEYEKMENSLNEKTAKVTELTTKVTELEQQKEVYENELKRVRESEIVAFVETAIEDGQILPANKETAIEKASKDFANFKEIVSMIPVKTKKSVDITNVITQSAGKKQPEGRDGWEFEQWTKEDSAGLKNIQDNEPERFAALLNAHIEKLS